MKGWPRPAKPRSPIGAAAAVIALWWFVAHNGGAGWVQFVGVLVFGALLVGVVGPAVAVGRARVAVRTAPTDGIAGLPIVIHVVTSSRVRVRPLDPPGDESLVGPVDRQGSDVVTIVPPRRGVHATLPLEVASAAPFALQWWSRRITVVLPNALHVAPRRGRPEPLRPDHRAEEAGVVVVRPHAEEGYPRGARPYVPGDARRRVHWRATAHTGGLMVKEMEHPSGQAATVVVDLPPDPDEAELAAGRALATVVELLDGGSSVLLWTTEAHGAVTEYVADRRQAGRRMARAVWRGEVAASAG